MTISNKKESLVLFAGDILVFLVSLWLTLSLRYLVLPSRDILVTHLVPFLFLFVVWTLVFFIAGLYGKHTILLKNRIPGIILNAQVANIVIAALFFFSVPYFGITPKTNLVLYLIISFGLIVFWRLKIFPRMGIKRKEKALLLGGGEESKDLEQEVNLNSRYTLEFVASADPDTLSDASLKQVLLDSVAAGVTVVVGDSKDPKTETLLTYNQTFAQIRFIDMYQVYEDIFDRIPTSTLTSRWIFDFVLSSKKPLYDLSKRLMDITLSFILGILSLVLYPFVFLAIKFDDGGAVFTYQWRVGKDNTKIGLVKFRTMDFNDEGKWSEGRVNTVTRVGEFLRVTRIDELPQLWNVLVGDLSLIGPRPEFPEPVDHYSKTIPHYPVRHLIKPGLSGWAQIHHEKHPHHGTDVKETAVKLSYDLYYVKNRSFLLDVTIVLQTIKTLLSRSGV